MSALQVYSYGQNEVRVAKLDEDGAPWFVAKDVCDVLGLVNNRDSLGALDDDERGVGTIDTLGGPQEMAIVSEAGLYSLVLRSRKPEAKGFKRWVTHEVLPQIRRTGRYEPPQPEDELGMIEMNARAVVQMVGEIRDARRIATEALRKADEHTYQIAGLTTDMGVMIERQQTALASIPLLPVPAVATTPRTRRDDVVEILRATAIATSTEYSKVTTRAYRELKYREKIDVLARVRNLKKQPGQSRVTGLDVVERLGYMEQLYAICVTLYGRPTNPLPNGAPESV